MFVVVFEEKKIEGKQVDVTNRERISSSDINVGSPASTNPDSESKDVKIKDKQEIRRA
jgi:hypothetical protein